LLGIDIEVAEIVYDVDGVGMVGLRTPRLMHHGIAGTSSSRNLPPDFDGRQFAGIGAGLSSLQRRRQMDHLISQYFPHMVATLMLMFMLVLGGLSLQDALRGRGN